MRALFALGLMLSTTVVFAAIPKATTPNVEDLLKLSTDDRSRGILALGPSAYRELRRIAFTNDKPYELRWRAVIGMAWLGDQESLPDLEKAIDASDWFMRDAALKSLEKINRGKAIVWARKLMSDPALVVRSSAVRVIHDMHDLESEALLWEKLNAPENFRGEQSLWVRKEIVSALADLASAGTEDKFAQLLYDNDKSVQVPAIRGLERLTGKILHQDPRVALPLWKKRYAKK